MESISEIFKGQTRSGRRLPFYGAGFTTRHDTFAVAMTEEELLMNVEEFLRPDATEAELRQRFSLCTTGHWSFARAREGLTRAEAKKHIRRFLYRPFDFRYTAYTPLVIGEMRPDVMRHLTEANVALVSTRRVTGKPFDNFFVSNTLVEYKAGSHDRNTQVFPLYFYPATKGESRGQADLHIETSHGHDGPGGRGPNLNLKFVANFEERLRLPFVSDGRGDLKKTFGPEDVFNYMYAAFYSPTYRTRYAEFLKSDFPRVPLTSNLELFRSLCGLGGELVALHLLESPKLEKPIARFPVKGLGLVEKGFPKYVRPGEPEPGTDKPLAAGRVYVSKNDPQNEAKGQYFEGVPPEVWNFHIGGYQVCEKWLKDRRGRTLTYDDLEHYCKVVTAINETIRLMAEIDAAIPKWPVE
jgi:hypothetical protein